jgi:preprotein translocase subunit YajC
MKQFLFAAADGQPAQTNPQPTPTDGQSTLTAGQSTPQQVTGETQPPDNNGAAPAPKQPQGGGFGMWIPMLIIFAIFYFLMIKPQQRKEKERRKMISELRAGARVVFAGGLIGTIVEAKETTFKIEIAGDVVIEVARNAVQGLAAEDKPAEPAKK